MSKCWHCEASNQRESATCWACGVTLGRKGRGPVGHETSYDSEAMRHFSAATSAFTSHRVWLDGLVLVCTILFGLVLGNFFVNTMPATLPGRSGTTNPLNLMRSGPLAMFLPQPKALPVQPVGAAEQTQHIVAQVAQVHRSDAEAGAHPASGSNFLTALVVIDNQGTSPLSYSVSDWKLRDSHGRTHSPRGIDNAGWLSSGRVGAHQQVQGQLTFDVPADETDFQITFEPSGLGALMRWDTSTAAR